MKRKAVLIILSLVCAFFCALGLAACDDNSNQPADEVVKDGIVYQYTIYGEEGTYCVSGYLDDMPSEVTLQSELNGTKVTLIESEAFKGCTKMTSVKIPDTVEIIGESAFEGSGLTSVIIPDSVEYVDAAAFKGCSSLKTLYIGGGVRTWMGQGHFYDCPALETIGLGAPIVDGEEYDIPIWNIFHNVHPKHLDINRILDVSVEHNGEDITYHSQRIYMDKIVDVKIGPKGFVGFVGMFAPSYEIDENNPYYSISDGLVTELRSYSDESKAAYVLPGYSGVLTIPDNLLDNGSFNVAVNFEGTSITGAVLPQGLTNIHSRMFKDCSSLESVDIPDTVEYIEESAFEGCTSLTNAVLPDSVTWISESAFKGCTSLTSTVVPSKVRFVGASAFEGCSGLKTVRIESAEEAITSADVFKGCTAIETLTVNGRMRAGTFAGCNAVKALTIKSEWRIGDYFSPSIADLFKARTDAHVPEAGVIPETLRELTLVKSGIRELYWSSQLLCDSTAYLEKVVIGDGAVDYLRGNAFADCASLKNVEVGDDVSLSPDAFAGCSLDTLTLGKVSVSYDNVLNVDAQKIVFSCTAEELCATKMIRIGSDGIEQPIDLYIGETRVTDLVIPDGVTQIAEGAFRNTTIESVSIPDSVTSIGENAFSGCTLLNYEEYGNARYLGNDTNPYLVLIKAKQNNITNCTIHNNTKFICGAAFSGCTGLTEISIPDSVTSIGNYAFSDCTKLTGITIPDGVKNIGNSAFENCDGFTSVAIPDGVTSIGDKAFYLCDGLSSITVGVNNVNYASQDGILYDKAKTQIIHVPYAIIGEVAIPDSVTSIGNNAFSGCAGLTGVTVGANNVNYASQDGILYNKAKTHIILVPRAITGEVTIPDGVTDIETKFRGCTGLTGITIPDSVTSIELEAFYGCTGLKNVTIGNGVTSIGINAFRYCAELKSVIIGNGVTSIGSTAFYGCTGLTEISIPDSVTSIGDSAFSECAGLTGITVGANNVNYASQDGILYDKAKTQIILVPKAKTGEVTIPDSVEIIGNSAFSGCSGLTSITIPNSVTSIGNYAFSDCTGLTGITIPNSVTSIGDSAFSGCTGFTGITIPNSVTSIGSAAFSGCSIETATLSVAVLQSAGLSKNSLHNLSITGTGRLESNALSEYSQLTELYIADTVFPASNSLNGLSALEHLTISFSASSGAQRLGPLFGQTQTQNTRKITQYLLNNNTLFSNEYYIPSSLTRVTVGSLAQFALSGISGITVDFTEDFRQKVIPAYAFYNSGITSITVPDSVGEIEQYAFAECASLATVDLGSATHIDGRVFYNCTSLSVITIPSTVKSIRSLAFDGCSGLTSVTFENTFGWGAADLNTQSGVPIDVTDAARNAANIKGEWCSKMLTTE